jgi:uncharacterized protein with PQ loop repeat
MKKRNISEAIGMLVSLGGALAMAGWLLDIEAVKSIRPGWESMKLFTALSFFLYGITLSFIARFRKNESQLAIIAIPILSMMLLLLMASLLASAVISARIDSNEMLMRFSAPGPAIADWGMPSLGTMIGFILLALSGFLTTMNIRSLHRAPVVFGATVAAIGALAILGYGIDRSWLYSAVPGKFDALPIHAAMLFILSGTGMVLAGRGR